MSSGIVTDQVKQDIDGQLASLQDVAQPRMTLNYTLFRGASIRFHDVDTAPHQARLMGEKPAIKRSGSFACLVFK